MGRPPAAQVASLVQARPKPIQEHLLTALDICLARAPDDQPQMRKWLAAAVEAADPDPWRRQARDAVAAGDLPALERLVEEPSAALQRPVLLHLFMSQLPRDARTAKGRLNLLMQQADPGEFWAPSRFFQASAYDLLAFYLATSESNLRMEGFALELATKAVTLSPNDANFWNTLGTCQYRVRNWQPAIAALAKAMQLSGGGDADDWLFFAMAHWQLGDRQEARKWYDQAVEWMNRNSRQAEDFRRFRVEAAELLGVENKK
ncbi:MAG TPA: hypothetical protein VGQ99_14365 [Tepidisphaeraceae bacterium]|nr:hypothetical protein [Tepidisphaeraceae bacterium]